MIGHSQVKLHYLKLQTVKQVEFIKVSDKPTYDTPLITLDLEIRDFEYYHE